MTLCRFAPYCSYLAIARKQAPAWLAAIILLSTVAHAAIEFTGVLVMPDRSLFALVDDPAKPAAWRALGQEFAGYALASFDAKTDTLVLTKDGATMRLHLEEDAKVKNAGLSLSGTITIGQGEKLEVTRATLVFDQETLLPLNDGLTVRIIPHRLATGRIRCQFSFDRTTHEGELTRVLKISAPAIIAREGDSFQMAVGDLAFAFVPTALPAP